MSQLARRWDPRVAGGGWGLRLRESRESRAGSSAATKLVVLLLVLVVVLLPRDSAVVVRLRLGPRGPRGHLRLTVVSLTALIL